VLCEIDTDPESPLFFQNTQFPPALRPYQNQYYMGDTRLFFWSKSVNEPIEFSSGADMKRLSMVYSQVVHLPLHFARNFSPLFLKK
jgi:hypothetical protein